ncbi:hypothetical protein QCA50_008192 [Cerrena zonata]|uniref:F-box domain-containing protein n=1 Tax=Cerrena zonata TaxID=2478898 RepID=A0AAW0GBG9_9APHY
MFSRNYSNLPILLARPSGAGVVTEAELEQDNIGKTLCDDMKKQVKARYPTASRSNAPGTIEGLPVEIMVIIFDRITHINDIASLSLANKTLVGKQQVYSDAKYQIACEECSDIHRGRWTGDKFEITTMGRAKNLVEEWKGVSGLAAKRMEAIWKAEFRRGVET